MMGHHRAGRIETLGHSVLKMAVQVEDLEAGVRPVRDVEPWLVGAVVDEECVGTVEPADAFFARGANVQYVNDTQLQGTGAVGSDEWRKV